MGGGGRGKGESKGGWIKKGEGSDVGGGENCIFCAFFLDRIKIVEIIFHFFIRSFPIMNQSISLSVRLSSVFWRILRI